MSEITKSVKTQERMHASALRKLKKTSKFISFLTSFVAVKKVDYPNNNVTKTDKKLMTTSTNFFPMVSTKTMLH